VGDKEKDKRKLKGIFKLNGQDKCKWETTGTVNQILDHILGFRKLTQYRNVRYLLLNRLLILHLFTW
jgi:hypothetical protein